MRKKYYTYDKSVAEEDLSPLPGSKILNQISFQIETNLWKFDHGYSAGIFKKVEAKSWITEIFSGKKSAKSKIQDFFELNESWRLIFPGIKVKVLMSTIEWPNNLWSTNSFSASGSGICSFLPSADAVTDSGFDFDL